MLIWQFWPIPEGGAERQCRLLSRELARRGIDVTVLTSWPGFGTRFRENLDGVHIVRCGWARPMLHAAERMRNAWVQGRLSAGTAQNASHEAPTRARRLQLLGPFRWTDRAAFMLGASRALRRIRPDIVHVHESHWIAGVAAWNADQMGVPCVCKESTYPGLPRFELYTPRGKFWDRQRRRCDRYVVLTEEGRRRLVEQGIAAERIVVIPNGVELPDLAKRAPDSNTVLCVGNLTQGAVQKGFDTLISAWARVVSLCPHARLVVAGHGDAGPWERMAGELRCQESVSFPGYCADTSGLFARAAVFVLPSRVEGMSNALLEAQSWGIPCVVTDIPANRAVVRAGENGLVVPVNDAAALAEGMVRLLKNEAERQALGSMGRRVAEEKFSISKVTDRWTDLYATALREARTQQGDPSCAVL